MAGKNNRILLWRHGQTDWNVVNRFQGHSDIELNNVGIYQAQLAAPIIAGMEPTAILSSVKPTGDTGKVRPVPKTAQMI